eukprot:COSAG02_NODE_54030_length_298_cov_0.839196_2_plen_21_part_01
MRTQTMELKQTTMALQNDATR